jgi:hypothetical protein
VKDQAQVLVTFLDPEKIGIAKLRQLIEHLETVAGIQQGFDELNAGQTRSLASFTAQIRQKQTL